MGTPADAAVAVNTLSSGQSRITAAGQIAVCRWTSVVVSSSQVGGGTTNRRGPAIGSYYVDGNLIAIADQKDGIRRGS